jgi:hypothetical protein
VSGRARIVVAALALLAVLVGVVLVAFAGNACPASTPGQPCPAAGANRIVVVTLAAAAVGLLIAPFAFLSEFVARRRIVFRGAWARAARRGLLAAALVAALAGLRLAGALSVAGALFLLTMAAMIEWFAVRRLDLS